MKSKFIRTVSKFLISGILFSALLFFSSCDTWMSNDDFMSEIESEVHDANAEQISVYVRYANAKMGSTEPQGRTTMKVDVASKISAITSDDYGFVKWAAFSTNDFPPDKQHSALTYVSEEDYNENYKKKELPSSVIKFSNPNSISTDVKILSARNDIFIIPIVTTRPTYVQSVPANGRSAVVKNSSIRIRFSKAIDKKTLYDSEGACNISITSSPAVFTDDDNEMEAKDITEDFDFEFSPSGKMLTLTLKDDALLDNNSQITITIYEGLCDEYGFSMSKNYSFSFTTGTKTDSLAPMIEVLVGAKDDSGTVDTFVSYYNGAPDNKHNPQLEGKATDSSRAAGIDLTKYTDELYAQRVYDSLNIFVKANDIIGADQNVAHDSNTLSEENVAFIGLQATLFTNNNGDAPDTTKNGTKIEKKNYGYVPGSKDSGVTSKKLFTDIVPLDKDGKKYSGGTIYTYDLKDLEDGLIRIDVWAIDMVGNSGEWGAPGASYYKDHDNGFKSIFVIKDTTPIDSNTVKTQKKVVSNSEAAPYYWYNSQTLKTMLLFDKPENKITDSGHPKLRSLDENLFWTFAVGSENNIAPEASSNEWVRIHNATTGESIPFPLNNAVEPTKDGSVDITVFLKDDLGNVSKPVVLDSIMYDNTKPTVTLKSGKGDFVTATGVEDLHVSGTENKVIEQILKVTIDEKNVDNAGSGIRRIEIHVKKDGQEVAVPLDPTKFAVKYAPSSITNPTPSSTGIIPVRIVPAGTDSSMAALDENKIKVFDVTDSNKITSGTLFVYGITLGDSDGTYKVEVDLYDSAMNKTPATAVTQISRDTTDPVISKVQVMDVASRKVYGQDEETWWLPYDRFEDANKLTKVTLKITANEAGSGLKYLKLAENAEFTENTKLYVGSELLTRDTDYKLNTATKTIELLDWYTPKLINANGGSHEITLENIKLNNINVPADAAQGQGNKIKLTTDDFVGKTTDNANNIYYGDTSVTGTLVYADSIAPVIATLVVDDIGSKTAADDKKKYDSRHYTDSQTVNLTLTLGDTEVGNKGSGVNKVILSDNAVFTDATEIFVKNQDNTETKLFTPADYKIALDIDNKSVTFTKVFTETNTLIFKNVNIFSGVQGNQVIKADVQDFAGIKSTTKATEPIVLDKTNPKVFELKWEPTSESVTDGFTNKPLLDDQDLKIYFTDKNGLSENEDAAGVKVIKLDVKKQGAANEYSTPFASYQNKLKLFYEGYESIKELTPETEYKIDGKYIILTDNYKIGTFYIRGITINNSVSEGEKFDVTITLFDAAENQISSPEVIDIDTVAPEITEDLLIEDLLCAVEVKTSGSQSDYWLPQEYIDVSPVSAQNSAPHAIPVKIKVLEETSGIKVINFTGDAVLNTDTLLCNGTTGVAYDHSIYDVDDKANTITIREKLKARELFAKNSEFELLIKNVGFKNLDTAGEGSSNVIKVAISDVATNIKKDLTTGNIIYTTTTQSRIHSDSRVPDAPQNLKLTDRAHSATTKTIQASDHYTNESIVDMTFNLNASEQNGSGYHEFVLTSGASFIGGGSADKTTLTIKDSDGNVIPNVDFELSQDRKTLTLKKTNQTSGESAVIRQAVSVEIKNIQLTNPPANGTEHYVYLKAKDLVGWDSTATSDYIYYDTDKPALEKGVFAANYTNSSAAYYQPSINVYPHANGESATGVPINYGTETYQKDIPTFYTATTYKTSGYYQYKGQVSSSSSSVNTNFDHGAVLGIRAKDNIRLGGWTRAKTFLYYYKYTSNDTLNDTLFSKTEADILTASNPTLDINNKGNNNNQPNGNNTATGTTLWFGFDEGKYSAVIVDEAGNCSNVFHFAVVRDVDQPKKSTTAGDANNLNERVLLQKPDASANIFTNSAVSIIRTSDGFPRFWGCGGTQDTMSANSSMKTKKYVTKKSGDKYKIQLNLGGTVSEPTLSSKINGGTASNVDPYSDLTATKTSSPIEKYAVSTLYGSWPDADHPSYKYCPVVPSDTSLPSGQTYSNSSSICKDYFGYTNGFSDYWYIYNSSSANWHPYKTSTSSNTDSYSYSSLSVSITSYVDSNNNLIIEIPNTKSTVPISVFLKDGCGNMQYVVCGLYQESGNDVAISFVIDDKLGSASTSNGVVTTPFIIQFPYSTYDSEGSDVPWGGYNFHAGTQSGNSEAPSSQYGTGQTRGFIKDFVKHATYYNPKLSNSSEILQFKHGFALHFFPNGVDRNEAANITGKEDITFDDTNWTDKEKAKGIRKASTDDIAAGNYTCRALMYCTNSPATPTYAQIKACLDAEKNRSDSEKTGQVTDWSYVQVSSSAIEAILFVDYPKPNYTKLNWNVNENNGEPKPFYMWYIFEDAVGNYELAKVVNDATSGNYLKTTNSSHFDKWLYDAEAPKLTIRGSKTTLNPNGTSPDTITAANISQLVPTNNGFVPYANGNNIYVHASKTHTSVQSGGSLNNPTSLGITHTADNSEGNYSKYNSFVDLEVSERTGVRMYAWTTSANSTFDYPTSSSNYGWKDYWLTSSTPYWYVGYGGISPVDKDIGNGSYTYDSCPQSAYYYGNTNTAYTGVYAGVKICTTIPYGKLSTSTATELWLHVMDWTGNISHYRMGAEGVKFINDSTAPTYSSSEFTGITEPDQYYLSKAASSDPVVRIAGNGPTAKAGSAIKLYIPKTWLEETGSGIKGYSFSNTGLANATYDESGKPYLNLTYNDYHYNDTETHEKTFYVYDNVGNREARTINLIFDNKPPKITKVAFVTKLDSSDQGKFCDADNGVAEQDGYTAFGSVRFYTHKDKNSANKDINLYHEDISHFEDDEVQEIYINKAGAVKFQVNFDSEILTETDYLDDIKINRWNTTTSGWDTVTSWKSNSTSWWTGGLGTVIRAMGTSDSDGYDKLTYTADGTYYQILATDISGNASCQYFKLYLDNQGPELVARTDSTSTTPTIELGKGSINQIGSGDSAVYYYTADSTHKATIKFAMTDAGMKNSKQKFYYSFDNSTWETINNPADTLTEINATVASGNLDKIYLKDMLGNPSSVDVNFDYSYTNTSGASVTMPIPKISYYSGTAPATPIITIDKITTASSHTSEDYNTDNTRWLNNANDTVLITSKDVKKLKIEFTKPNNYIIGYLVTEANVDAAGYGEPVGVTEYVAGQEVNGVTPYFQQKTSGIINKQPNTDIGSFSFYPTNTEIIEYLPMLNNGELNSENNLVTRKYWAVDVVGNISAQPLVIQYSYDDPNKAKDITLIESIDKIEGDDTVKQTIKNDLEGQLTKFATIDTNDGNKSGTIYFNNGYILLSCTLPQKADTTYTTYAETPSKVELYDVWYDWGGGHLLRGSSINKKNNSTSQLFKVYPSDKKTTDGKRWYCYIAFKINGDFDNNKDWGGSVIHAKIYGGDQAQSDYAYLKVSDVEQEDNYGWQIDNDAPFIDSEAGFYAVSDNVKKLKNFNIKDPPTNTSGALNSIPKAKDNIVRTDNNQTNVYKSGSHIYFYIHKDRNSPDWIRDQLKGKDDKYKYGKVYYKFVVTEPETSSNKHYDATILASSEGWSELKQEGTINSGGVFGLTLPDVTTANSHIALFFKDWVDNVSEPYYLGDRTDETVQWWILDNRLSQMTITPPSGGWKANEAHKFTVSIPEGSIVKSVTAKVTGTKDDGTSVSSSITPSSVKFLDYSSDPTLNGTQGWVNKSGLEVTLPAISQAWYNQFVTITLNYVDENNTGISATTTNYFVPAKTFTGDNITINTAGAELTVENNVRVCRIPYSLTDNAPDTKLSSITTSPADVVTSVSFDKQNSKIVLTGVPSPSWDGDITIGATINGTIDMGTIYTVAKRTFAEGDITLDLENKSLSDTTLTIPVTLKNNCPVDAITSIEGKVDTTTLTAELNDEGTQVTISGIPAAAFTGLQEVKLLINSIDLGTVYTVPKRDFAAGDITLGNTTLSGEKLTIEFTLNNNCPKSEITSVSGKYGETTLTGRVRGSVDEIIINNIPSASWDGDQVIKLYLNSIDMGTVYTVAKKELAMSDIQSISDAAIPDGGTNYQVTITLKSGIPEKAITSVSADNCTAAFLQENGSTVKTKIVLTSVPAPVWADAQDITIKLNNNDNITKKVLTVAQRALTTDDFELSTATASGSNYVIDVTLKNDAPATIITNSTLSATNSVTAAWDSTNKKITLSNIPSASWDNDTNIELTVNGNNMGTVVTIPKRVIQQSELSASSNPASWTVNKNYTVTVYAPKGAPISSVKSLIGTTETNLTASGLSNGKVPNNGQFTVTVGKITKAWTAMEAKVVVNGIAVKLFDVEARTLTNDEVNVTCNPDSWTSGSTYTITVTAPTGAVITSVKSKIDSAETELPASSITGLTDGVVGEGQNGNGTFTVILPAITQTGAPQNVKLVVNGSIEKDLFTVAAKSDNIGSRAAFSGFKQTSASDLEVAGDAPKTRSISLRNWVADLFGGDSEAVDLAAGDAAPLTKKEAKKAAKKAAKAAGALKAAESSAQPAAGLEDLVVAAAEAAGQTLDAVVSEAEASAKPAQIEAEASAPVMSGLEPAAGEASAEEAAPSKAALFLVMAVFCAAIAGIIIFCLKKKPAKK